MLILKKIDEVHHLKSSEKSRLGFHNALLVYKHVFQCELRSDRHHWQLIRSCTRSVTAQFQTCKKNTIWHRISAHLMSFTCPFVCLLCDLQTCFLPQGCTGPLQQHCPHRTADPKDHYLCDPGNDSNSMALVSDIWNWSYCVSGVACSVCCWIGEHLAPRAGACVLLDGLTELISWVPPTGLKPLALAGQDMKITNETDSKRRHTRGKETGGRSAVWACMFGRS